MKYGENKHWYSFLENFFWKNHPLFSLKVKMSICGLIQNDSFSRFPSLQPSLQSAALFPQWLISNWLGREKLSSQIKLVQSQFGKLTSNENTTECFFCVQNLGPALSAEFAWGPWGQFPANQNNVIFFNNLDYLQRKRWFFLPGPSERPSRARRWPSQQDGRPVEQMSSWGRMVMVIMMRVVMMTNDDVVTLIDDDDDYLVPWCPHVEHDVANEVVVQGERCLIIWLKLTSWSKKWWFL